MAFIDRKWLKCKTYEQSINMTTKALGCVEFRAICLETNNYIYIYNICFFTQTSLKFILKGPINNITVLAQAMDLCLWGDKPLPYLCTHINRMRFDVWLHTCAHFCYKMVYWGIWDWCIVGFARQVYMYATRSQYNRVNHQVFPL